MRKVLGIVATQLSLTFAMCLASAKYVQVGSFMNRPDVCIWSFVALMTSFCLLCCKQNRHKVPRNYILLAIATIAEATSVAAMSAEYDVGAVVTSIFVLAVTLVCLSAASFATRTSAELENMLTASCVLSSLVILFVTPFILVSFYGG